MIRSLIGWVGTACSTAVEHGSGDRKTVVGRIAVHMGRKQTRNEKPRSKAGLTSVAAVWNQTLDRNLTMQSLIPY